MGRLFAAVAFLLCAATVVLVPAAGVWLASSLISFHGGPTAVALLGGALLFPVLPVVWELRATAAWKRRSSRPQFGVPPKRKAQLGTRLVLRTLALNVVFLAGLAGWFPEQS